MATRNERRAKAKAKALAIQTAQAECLAADKAEIERLVLAKLHSDALAWINYASGDRKDARVVSGKVVRGKTQAVLDTYARPRFGRDTSNYRVE